MLLLVTIGLVVVGAIALVIGFVSNSLGPIYISIACSVIAGAVLVAFSRMARRGDTGASAGPASASPGSWSPAATTTPPAAPAAPTYQPAPAPSPPPPPPVRTREPEREPTITMDTPVLAEKRFKAPSPAAAILDGDDDFPIAGYDTLRATQIVALLGDLDLDELDMVQEREEQTKNRATVLRQVVSRIDELEAEDAVDAPMAAEAAPVAEDFAAADTEFPAAADDEFPADDDGFPIAGYDQLSADEIIAVLDDLEDEELDMVAEREETGQNRAEILDYIDDMFEEVGHGGPASPRAGAAASTPAPPAPAKMAPTKKVAAKKAAPAGRRAAVVPPVAKVAARKAATGKAAAAKAPAKATAAKATAAKAVPAKRASSSSSGTTSPGRRAAEPVAKKTVAKKVVAKKAVAKKAPATKAAAPTRKR